MRNRILLLFAFASLLGTPVLMHRAARVTACMNLDAVLCATMFPDPWWLLPLGFLSLLMLGYAAYLLATAWVERRREKDMLEAVGVHVQEKDLPLEE